MADINEWSPLAMALKEKLMNIAKLTNMDYGNVSYEMKPSENEAKYKFIITVVYNNDIENVTERVEFYTHLLSNAIHTLSAQDVVKIEVLGANDVNETHTLPF